MRNLGGVVLSGQVLSVDEESWDNKDGSKAQRVVVWLLPAGGRPVEMGYRHDLVQDRTTLDTLRALKAGEAVQVDVDIRAFQSEMSVQIVGVRPSVSSKASSGASS